LNNLKKHRYYARYYYYQREIEGFNTYENFLSLYEISVEKVFDTDREISLGGLILGNSYSLDALKDEKSFLINNQYISSHVMLIKKDIFGGVKLKLIYHFMDGIFFYGKLIVSKMN